LVQTHPLLLFISPPLVPNSPGLVAPPPPPGIVISQVTFMNVTFRYKGSSADSSGS